MPMLGEESGPSLQISRCLSISTNRLRPVLTVQLDDPALETCEQYRLTVVLDVEVERELFVKIEGRKHSTRHHDAHFVEGHDFLQVRRFAKWRSISLGDAAEYSPATIHAYGAIAGIGGQPPNSAEPSFFPNDEILMAKDNPLRQ